MTEKLTVLPIGLRWLSELPAEDDLCAHGGVRVVADGTTVIDTGEEDFAVSTGALHLMRSVGQEHTPEKPLAEHLIPHCGHFMYSADSASDVRNLGCADGVNWWVYHTDVGVELEFEQETRCRMTLETWRRAVVAFADRIAEFYAASPAKVPTDVNDRDWYARFKREWHRRRALLNGAV